MTRRIVFAPEAEAQIDALLNYIAGEASLAVAALFVKKIVERIEALADFSERGTPPR